jgi:glutathione peroxidase
MSLPNIALTKIDGTQVRIADFKGQVLLVVNIASACGFKGQLASLERLYLRYKDKGLLVLGFPSSDFLGQEPLSGSALADFCKINFGVTFPLFVKDHVRGKEKQELFKELTNGKHGYTGEIWWNYEKFLIDRQLEVKGRYRSITSPESAKIVRAIEEVL